MESKSYIKILLIALLLSASLGAKAQIVDTLQHEVDSVGYSLLDSTVFVSQKKNSAIELGKDSKLTLNMDLMASLPKFLGNTDPIQVLKFMPGVQTVSEFDSGINIQGCDDAHNELSLGGVPIYGAAHLFGFFSVFNPSHFEKFDFSKNASEIGDPNRIGASIRMASRRFEKEKVTGELNTGIMSSQGTFSWRISPKVQLHLSARQSYMNLLYKRWMQFMDYPFRYDFGDYNLTLLYQATDRDLLTAEAYFGRDRMHVHDPSQGMINVDIAWGNWMGALHWDRQLSSGELKQTFWASSYGLEAEIRQDINHLKIPSRITSYGYKAAWQDAYWKAGGDLIGHEVRPQAPMWLDDTFQPLSPEYQNGLEADLWAGYEREYGIGLGFSAGAKVLYYLDPERKSHGGFTPDLSIWYDSYSYGRFTLAYSWLHQYLFKTGLPNMGLPLDFWFMAGRHSQPQAAHSVTLAYNATFLNGMLALDFSTYFKHLDHQIEYRGSFLDFFTSNYDLDRFLYKGRGMNYGFNVMLQKVRGAFTGWISYSLGRSLRNFEVEDYRKWYPSNHERIHELNVVANYKIKRWDLSASFVCASGLPFTPPKDFYITSGHLVTSYGEYNSRRVEPYVRLDISANFMILKKKGQEFGADFSMFNVLGNWNPVGYQLRMDENGFRFGKLAFALRFVPSFSLYYKF